MARRSQKNIDDKLCASGKHAWVEGQPQCNECRRLSAKQPKVQKRKRERLRELRKDAKFREIERERARARYKDPKVGEAIRKRKRTLAKNPKQRKTRREREKKRYQKDPQYKLTKLLRNRLKDAIKGNFKSGSAVQDLGVSIPEFKLYIENQFEPGMTWENWGKGNNKWNIDHVIPLSSFDLTDRTQFLEACNWLNLQPMWEPENNKKGAKYGH